MVVRNVANVPSLTTDAHANVTVLRPLSSVLNLSPSLNILSGSTPHVRQPHTACTSAITQSSW